jgi:GT2 family glycosyltransferase
VDAFRGGQQHVDTRVKAPVNASVIIPTVGRPVQLATCLRSLAACEPRAQEIVVVDQSGEREMRRVVGSYAGLGVRLVTSRGRGRGLAINEGLAAAGNELVLVTDDDCTVEQPWIGVAASRLNEDADAIYTGRVLPLGDTRLVPSTIALETGRDYTGELHCRALYAGNMAARRSALLDFGGFDEQMLPSSEDNDLCYRWLRAGRALRYEPKMVVWHHDWRTQAELEQLYVTYARGQGVFYAKHLRGGDPYVLRYLARDLLAGLNGTLLGLLRRTPRSLDARRGILRGLPGGLVTGWRTFGNPRDRGGE